MRKPNRVGDNFKIIKMKMNKLLSTLAIIIALFPTSPNSQSMADWRRVTDNENSAATQKDTTKLNIDGLKVSPANFKLLLENKYVRVLE